jgi:hypothetical protein
LVSAAAHVSGEASWQAIEEDAMLNPILVLLVTDPETSPQLVGQLEPLDNVQVLTAPDCRQARRTLDAHPEVSVILTNLSHADGNWCDLLRFVVNRGLKRALWFARPNPTKPSGRKFCGGAVTTYWSNPASGRNFGALWKGPFA